MRSIGVAAAAIAKGRRHAGYASDLMIIVWIWPQAGGGQGFQVGRDVWPGLGRDRGLGVDVLLEMAGTAPAINEGFRALRKGGWAALLGLPSKPVEIDLADGIIFKGAKVYGINGRRMYETWYQMQALLRAGLDLTPLITHRFKFEEFEEAFALAISGNSVKIILYP